MAPPYRPFRVEDLLAHREWIERTARALVRGDAEAEDVGQQAWLEMLRDPPAAAPASPRAWLRAVLRFTAVDRIRGAAARRVHESAAARRTGAAPDPADVVERAEVLERVARAVLALEEPYRTAILLRHFDGMSPTAIAAAQRIPLETVRTRLRRGLERLRHALRGLVEDRKGRALLLAVARRDDPAGPETGAAIAAGGAVMAKKTAALVTVLLIVAATSWTRRGDLTPIPPPADPTASAAARTSRPEVAGAALSSTVPAPRDAESCVLHVVVTDADGAPVAGAAVEARRSEPFSSAVDPLLAPPPGDLPVAGAAVSASDGAASLRVSEGHWVVAARAEGYGAAAATTEVVGGAAEDPVRIVLERAARLEGRVFGYDGTPRRGDVVEATPASAEPARARVVALSDDAGRYSLEGLAPGFQRILLRTQGGARRHVGVVHVQGTVRFDIELGPEATFRGRVVDADDGSPIADAIVGIHVAEPDGTFPAASRTRTDATGRFSMDGLPRGRILGVAVGAQGFLTWPDGVDPMGDEALRRRHASGDDEPVTIRLRRGATVRGHVRMADGTPVPGARVRFVTRVAARGSAQGRTSGVASTGSDGAFVVAGVHPGPNVVVASARGFCAPGAVEATLAGSAEDPRWCLDVPVSGEAAMEVVLTRGAVVRGVVAGPEGRPAAGVRVCDERTNAGGGSGATVTTGADGRFELGSLPPGAVRILARGPSGLRGFTVESALEEGAIRENVRIVLRPGAVIAGTVSAADGVPLPGAKVVVVRGVPSVDPGEGVAAALRRGRPIPVDAHGRFRAEGLDAGDWTLVAASTGRRPTLRVLRAVREESRLEDIVLSMEPGRILHGRAVDERGAPIEGATVATQHDGAFVATTGADGAFTVTGPDDGGLVVTVAAVGRATRTLALPADREPGDVVLRRPLSLAGRITDTEGRPLAGVEVSARAEAGQGATRTSATGADGRFRMDGLDDGNYDLLAGAPGDGWVVTRFRGVAAGTEDVVIAVERGAVIVGRILDTTGRPVPGAHLRAAGEGPAGRGLGRNGVTLSRADGTFELSGLLPGAYTVSAVSADPRWTAPAPATAVPAGTRDLSFVAELADPGPPLPPPGDRRIEGRVVLRGGGVPPEGTRVLAVPTTAPATGAPVVTPVAGTDREGRFSVEGLHEGPHRLVAAWDSDALAPGWLDREVGAGATGVELEVEPSVTVSGRLEGPGVADVRWIRAMAEGAPSAAFRWSPVGTDGGFHLPRLPRGALRLEGLDFEGRTRALGTVTAPASEVGLQVR